MAATLAVAVLLVASSQAWAGGAEGPPPPPPDVAIHANAEPGYTTHLVPFMTVDLLLGLIRPIQEYMATHVDSMGATHICRSYRECALLTASGEFDFAYLSGPVAAYAISRGQVVPLVREFGENPTYLFTNVDSGIGQVSDLREDSIAIVDRMANPAFVLREMLAEAGLSLDSDVITYSPGPIDAVIMEVAEGRARAGLVESSDLSRMLAPVQQRLRVLAEAEPPIRGVFVASKRVPARIRQQAQEAWIAFGESEAGKEYFRNRPPQAYRVLSREDLRVLDAFLHGVDGERVFGLSEPEAEDGEPQPASP